MTSASPNNDPRYLEFMSGADGTLPFPRAALLSLSSLGHPGCPLCRIDLPLDGAAGQPRLISKPVLDRFILTVLPYVETVMMSGDGECLQAGGPIPYLLAFAAELKTRMSLCTDGIMLSEQTLESLVRYRLHELVVLVRPGLATAFGAEANAERRRLAIILQKLAGFKQLYGAEFPVVRLTARLEGEEAPWLLPFLDWAASIRAAEIVLYRGSSPLNGEKIAAANGESGLSLDAMLLDAAHKALQSGITLTMRQIAAPTASDAARFVPGLAPTCPTPQEQMMLSASGDVFCCRSNLQSIGNLYWQKFRTIWYGESAVRLRRELLLAKEPRRCTGCSASSDPFNAQQQLAIRLGTDIVAGTGLCQADPVQTYCVTGWHGTFFVQQTGKHALLMEVNRADSTGSPAAGYVKVNGKVAARFKPNGRSWETVAMSLPEEPVGWVRIDIAAEPSYRFEPTTRTVDQPRQTGFLLNRIRTVAWQRKAGFNCGMVFLGGEIVSSRVIPGMTFRFRSFWRLGQPVSATYSLLVRFIHDKIYADINRTLRRFMVRQKDRLFAAHHALPFLPREESDLETILLDEFEITPPPEIQPGPYNMEIGLFHEDESACDAITSCDWPLNEDKLLLGKVTIHEPPASA